VTFTGREGSTPSSGTTIVRQFTHYRLCFVPVSGAPLFAVPAIVPRG
jgi:hypothetical protein